MGRAGKNSPISKFTNYSHLSEMWLLNNKGHDKKKGWQEGCWDNSSGDERVHITRGGKVEILGVVRAAGSQTIRQGLITIFLEQIFYIAGIIKKLFWNKKFCFRTILTELHMWINLLDYFRSKTQKLKWEIICAIARLRVTCVTPNVTRARESVCCVAAMLQGPWLPTSQQLTWLVHALYGHCKPLLIS